MDPTVSNAAVLAGVNIVLRLITRQGIE